MTPFKVLQSEDYGTDEMHLVREQVEMPGSQNRPQLFGVDVNPVDHVNEIIERKGRRTGSFLISGMSCSKRMVRSLNLPVTKCARSCGRLRSMVHCCERAFIRMCFVTLWIMIGN